MTGSPARAADAAEIERVFREASGQAVATLIRVFGDISVVGPLVDGDAQRLILNEMANSVEVKVDSATFSHHIRSIEREVGPGRWQAVRYTPRVP